MFNKYLNKFLILLLCILCTLGCAKGGRGGGRRSVCRFGGSSANIAHSYNRSNSSDSSSYHRRKFTIFDIIFVCIMLFFIIIDNDIDKKSNKNKFSKKLLSKSNENFEEYCNNFIEKFTNLQSIPNEYDIKKVYDNIGRNALVNNILIPLLINKLKIIDNLSLQKQYDLFYKENFNIIDLFQLANNTVAKNRIKQVIHSSNEVNNFLEKHKYIKIKFAPIVSCSNKFYNKYLLKYGPISLNSENVLSMYFNQLLIFKEILLKVFLENNTNNNITVNDILHQISDSINIHVLKMNNKKQILLDAIIQNILGNKIFNEIFLSKIDDKISLNLVNYVNFLIKNCNNQSKTKKYKKLLHTLQLL